MPKHARIVTITIEDYPLFLENIQKNENLNLLV